MSSSSSGVSAGIGPISGINYGQLITGLTQEDQASIDSVSSQVNTLGTQDNALLNLSALITTLRISASQFTTSTLFKSATATSSNNSVLSATAGSGTPTGSYSFTVQRVASTSQLISQGYEDSDTTPLGTAGNLNFSFGGGAVNSAATLASLNGGSGVSSGSIRVTDGSGATQNINLTSAVDLNDVVSDINSATGVNVTASISDDHLVLTDKSGGAGTLTIANVGNSTTASDLGLTQNAASGGVITGADINKLTQSSSINSLNDGLGVRTAGVLNDFAINTASNGALNVSLSGAKTIGDVLSKINAAGNVGGTQVVTASISADGHGITLTQAGGGALSVTALNNSNAASDLGIATSSTTGTITGSRVVGGLDSALLSDLNGGQGVGLGTISITDRTGTVHSGIDLSGASTVNDVLTIINNANAGVSASLNSEGTGIVLTDTTGSSNGSITVANGTGTAATDLGLAQTSTGSTLNGTSLKLRVVSNNTLLSTLNGGTGLSPGKFQVTDATGATATIDLTGTNLNSLGDVINQINNNSTGIRASFDPDGNGIMLTDTSGGTGTASVADLNNGTTVESLGLKGAFTGGKLDGTFSKSVAIAATDTLQDVANKINLAGIGVSASIIDDGSGATPYRLSLTSRNSGAAGNLLFDGSALGISTTTLTQGQNAVVLYGSSGSANPLQITSATNTITGLVPNLTVNLASASATPVTVGVSQDTTAIPTAIQTFVTNYNAVVQNVATVTAFDPNNSSNNGVLFGDNTTQQIQDSFNAFIANTFNGVGSITSVAQLGITVNQDGTLALDNDTLNSELATNPAAVQQFFTSLKEPVPSTSTTPSNTPAATTGVEGFGQQLSDLITKFTDATSGIIFQESNSLETQEGELNDRINDLNTLLTSKKDMLVDQFANLEVTISGLQSQGSALSSISSTTSTKSS